MSDSDRDLLLPASSPSPSSPSSADPSAGLHAELLSLKQRSGLSYARISALTHYSKSSWERWINGKQFPPRAAVESFATAARADAGPLLELWDRADRIRGAADTEPEPQPQPQPDEQNTSQPVGTTPASDPTPVADPDPDPAPAPELVRQPGRRWTSPPLIAAAIASCAVLTAAGLATAHYSSNHPEEGKGTAANLATGSPASAHTDPVGCTHAGCTGKDPMTMGCSRDGQTLALIRNGKMVIELRYSKECGATWGRITYTKPKAVVDVNNSSGVSEASPVHWGNDVYSPMAELSGHQTSWACGTQPDGKSRTCTVHSPVPAGH